MIESKTRPKIIVEAVVTRADGTIENLGVISETYKSNGFIDFFKKITGGKNNG